MRVLTSLLLIAVTPVIHASAATLPEVVNAACTYHPEIQTARYQVEEAQERVNEARAIILPRITSVSEIGIADDDNAVDDQAINTITSTLANARPSSSTITFDQPLYLGGRAAATIKGAQFQREAEGHRSEAQILRAQLAAIQAYIDVARAQATLKVRQENIAALQKSQSDAQRRYELGAGTISDIAQASTRVTQGQADIITARRDIESAAARLLETSGIRLEGDLARPLLPPPIASLREAVLLARKVNPDVAAAASEIDVAKQNVKNSKAATRPQLRALGTLDAQRDTAFNGFERDEGRLRLQLTLPIYEGGANAARRRASLIAQNRIAFTHYGVLNQVQENVTTAWANLEAAERLVGANQALVKAAQDAASSIKKESDAGFRPKQDVLDAQRELLFAKLALSDVKFNQALSAYQLYGAIGRLDNTLFPDCQGLLPEITDGPKRPIIRELDVNIPFITNFPHVKIKEPEKRDRTGPRGRR